MRSNFSESPAQKLSSVRAQRYSGGKDRKDRDESPQCGFALCCEEDGVTKTSGTRSQESTRFLEGFLVDPRARGRIRWRNKIHGRVWTMRLPLELQDSLWEGMAKAQSCSLPQGARD